MLEYAALLRTPAPIIANNLVAPAARFSHLPFASLALARDAHECGIRFGVSVHDPEELAAALTAGASWLTYSPIYPSTSKPERESQGIAGLSDMCRRSPIPVFALGGITAERVGECLAAGAAGIAAISLFDNRAEAIEALRILTSFGRTQA
jgi:thiamine monophosphate synthase